MKKAYFVGDKNKSSMTCIQHKCCHNVCIITLWCIKLPERVALTVQFSGDTYCVDEKGFHFIHWWPSGMEELTAAQCWALPDYDIVIIPAQPEPPLAAAV